MTYELIIVFVVTLLVRIFGSVVSGNRLILIPLLIVLLDMKAVVALTTMKFSGLASSAVTIYGLSKEKNVNWNIWKKVTPWLFLGTIVGTFFVIEIDDFILKKVLGITILISAFVLIANVRNNKKTTEPKILDEKISYPARFLVALSGIFGGMVGSKGVILRYWYKSKGLDFLESTGTHKASSILSNIVSVALLIYFESIDWQLAIIMFIASAIGAWIGNALRAIFKKMDKDINSFLEKVFLCIVIIGALKVIF